MKKKIFNLFALAMVLLVAASCSDNTNFLYGDVVDKVTEKYIADCQVSLKDSQGKVLAVQHTGADGRWGFEVEVGVYTLAFAKEGYNTLEEDEVVVQDDNTLVKCWVKLSKEGVSEIDLEWSEGAAPTFEGGSGSEDDPYLIKTGRQLKLLEDYANSESNDSGFNYSESNDDEYNNLFFRLAGDIDLRNKNWRPITSFKGTLDGAGYTIHNLRVEYDDELGKGLFEKNEGTIKNLTIHGVTIKGNNAGAIAGENLSSHGSTDKSGQIFNCKVVFTQESVIQGTTVGGVVGINNGYIDGCTVTSEADSYSIQGNTIGGIVGSSNGSISNCHVSCNLGGEEEVGGIVGLLTNDIDSCGYQGNIYGINYVGGICGKFKNSYTSTNMLSCKAEAKIDAKDNIGGLVGYVEGSPKIFACYSTGSIACNQRGSSNISGLFNAGWNTPSCGYCYTTVECGHANFKPLAKSDSQMKFDFCYSVYDSSIYGSKQSVDVATLFEEEYNDEVDKYWDYANCWTWSGKVKGKQKSAVCPRLKWEEKL